MEVFRWNMPLLEAVGRPTNKSDLYLIAEALKPEEIHPEVVRKLDRMAEVLNRGDRGPGPQASPPGRSGDPLRGPVGA